MHTTKEKEMLPGVEEIGYQFKNKEILIEALSHPSYSAENAIKYDNQRLEFLGDSVIQIAITSYLYNKYPETDEGKLTKMRSLLTQKSTLANFALQVSIHKFIRMGHGEIKNNGHERQSTLCDAFEALCGAIYLDGGLRAAENFIIPLVELFYSRPEDMLAGFNPKGFLQELTQSKYHSKPDYKIEYSEGPDHKKNFTVSVWVNNTKIAIASASNKKTAESKAAESAIKILQQNKDIPQSDELKTQPDTEKTSNERANPKG